MSDWKHEQGYEEPKECGFCELFVRAAPLGTAYAHKGKCHYQSGGIQPFSKGETCHERGTCRHFKRKKS